MSSEKEYFDTHCHMDLTMARGVELETIQENLLENNTKTVIQIASDPDSFQFTPQFCKTYSDKVQFYYTIGLHPNEAHELDIEAGFKAIKENIDDKRFVGIGEIGLDYYYGQEHKTIQLKTFERFLQTAKEINKPVIIHTRNAHEDTLALLKNSGVSKILIHCFTGNSGQMTDFLDIGAYISFSGIVTFKNAVDVQESAKVCPLDRILIETDSPYLAPVPKRGGINMPGNVRFVGDFISNLRSEDLSLKYLENSRKFYFES